MFDILFCPFNGLGDKFLDIIGACVLCDLLNKKLHINLNTNNQNFVFGSGRYDASLFNINNISISNNNDVKYNNILISENPSVSLSPIKIFNYLNNEKKMNISYETILHKFRENARNIKPSVDIEKYIPKDIHNAYGIHLRATDKIFTNKGDARHETEAYAHNIIITNLLNDITNIIINEDKPMFFLASEDKQWKENIKTKIINIGNTCNKNIIFINYSEDSLSNIEGFHSVLDLFSLSRCKRIYQGIKYSTYSILASLIGNIELVNYANHINGYDMCIIHIWKPLFIPFIITQNIEDADYAAKPFTNLIIK